MMNMFTLPAVWQEHQVIIIDQIQPYIIDDDAIDQLIDVHLLIQALFIR
jgi:hypothetical protein